jgi:hypothetical protein
MTHCKQHEHPKLQYKKKKELVIVHSSKQPKREKKHFNKVELKDEQQSEAKRRDAV